MRGTEGAGRGGDVWKKMGAYLKALAAQDNGVPFYVGLPYPSIDWTLEDGRDIPIGERHAHEVSRIAGRTASGEIVTVDVLPEGSPAGNPAFDVTPGRLVTALITERGVCKASEAGLLSLYTGQAKPA